VHEATVADRSEQEWESEIEAENAGTQIAIGERDRMARTERDVVIHTAIFTERDFAFGAAIKVVKYGPGHSALGDGPQICDADRAARDDGAGRLSHSVKPVSAASLKKVDSIIEEIHQEIGRLLF